MERPSGEQVNTGERLGWTAGIQVSGLTAGVTVTPLSSMHPACSMTRSPSRDFGDIDVSRVDGGRQTRDVKRRGLRSALTLSMQMFLAVGENSPRGRSSY
jgi:hypothetical protein